MTRIYRFCAAHRLYSPELSDHENRQIYGKCSNFFGHGHNYVLKVTISGNPDDTTGALKERAQLDKQVKEKILVPWDHKFLDKEVADFQGKQSTGENMVQIIWEKLQDELPLVSVKLWETQNASFEYFGRKK